MYGRCLQVLIGMLLAMDIMAAAPVTPPVEGTPSTAAEYLQQGNYHLDRSELWDAINHFNKALELDASLDKAHLGRGIALGRARELDQALEELDYYIKRHPDDSFAYTKRGVTHLWRNDIQSAHDDLLKATQLDPTNAEALDDLGVVYAQLNDVEKALESFNSAIRHEPTYQKAYHNLALMHYALAEFESALSLVNRALQLMPTDGNAMLLKASILRKLGREKEAQALEEEVEFMPQGNWQEQMGVQ